MMRPDVEGLLKTAKAALQSRSRPEPPRPNMGSDADWHQQREADHAERMKAFAAFMELAKPEIIVALCEYIEELEDGPKDAKDRRPIPEADLLLLLEDEDGPPVCGHAEDLGPHAETHTQSRTRRQQWAIDHVRMHRFLREVVDTNCLVTAQAAEAQARFADGTSVHVPREVYEAECERAEGFRRALGDVTGLSSEAIEIAADERRTAWMQTHTFGDRTPTSSEGHGYTCGFEDGALWIQGYAIASHEK